MDGYIPLMAISCCKCPLVAISRNVLVYFKLCYLAIRFKIQSKQVDVVLPLKTRCPAAITELITHV